MTASEIFVRDYQNLMDLIEAFWERGKRMRKFWNSFRPISKNQ